MHNQAAIRCMSYVQNRTELAIMSTLRSLVVQMLRSKAEAHQGLYVHIIEEAEQSRYTEG